MSAEKQEEGCVFCIKGAAASAAQDANHFVLERGEFCFALLNIYPYTGGHLMIAPYAHVATLEECGAEPLAEMMRMIQRFEAAIRRAYKPGGINIGMNIGAAAGAGVAGHIHMHMLPRWFGDVNFMTTVAETRVIPEDLTETYAKLKAALSGA
ncbi:MAG: HIT domain-containing protein [Bryobacteraceae bacterium]